MGKADRAIDFVHLDAGPECGAWITPYIYLSNGNLAEAHSAAKNMGKARWSHRELLQVCTVSPRPADLAQIVRDNESSAMIEPSAELVPRRGSYGSLRSK